MKAKMDIITTLPQPIIETILCLLPTEEAARTSILSKDWSYKWTTIPKLMFCQSTICRPSEEEPRDLSHLSHEEYCRRKDDLTSKLICVVRQVLLLRRGPIHELTLMVDAFDKRVELDQIFLHLSSSHSHTLKKLTLDFDDPVVYQLPVSFFSLHHLMDLDLQFCDFNDIPMFNGFGSLTRLSLSFIRASRETLLQLLSSCPSLKTFYLFMFDDYFHGDERPSILELFKCLPVIEHLTIWGCIIPTLVKASVPGELPVSLIHLKYCKIHYICFIDGYGLPFLAVLAKCCPNLEKIDLAIDKDYDGDDETESDKDFDEIESVVLEKYSNVWLEHLNELKIRFFGNFDPELEFVKFILARSPNLENVILLTSIGDESEELELLNILLNAPRASPMLAITAKDLVKRVR